MTDVPQALKPDLALLKKKGAESINSAQNSFTVVKRNGSLVPFRRERIFKALEMAFRDTKKLEKEAPLPSETLEAVNQVSDTVVNKLVELAGQGTSLSVEGIQDLVEVTLMELDHHDVAKDYIIYRDQHKALREDSPQNVKVLRKDGSVVRFNPMKIASTVEESFRRCKNVEGPSGASIVDSVNLIMQKVVAKVVGISKTLETVPVDTIQDEIEQQLMLEGYFSAAKDFILYRAQSGEQSITPLEEQPKESIHQRQFITINQGGQKTFITEAKLYQRIKFACRGLEDLTSAEELLEESVKNFYEEMKESEVDQANIMAARARIEKEPAYSKIAARLLLDVLYRETINISADSPDLESVHRSYFKEYLKKGVSLERISPELLTFDLDKLAQAMQIQRDDQFSYLGLQTLYDRYFIHSNDQRMETPQIFWMRVAMGLAIGEEKKNQKAIEFYHLLSSFVFTSSTPTLFNSGTCHSQLSSCYLSTVMDDLSHIFKIVADDAQLSKWAGGIGNDWTNVRATGAQIKGTNGKSQGVIPFLKVANDTAVAVNQCFAPSTLVYTNNGIKSISDISTKDLVLGSSGTYRQVLDTFVYNQKEAMVEISLKHSIDPIHVTAGHPLYAIRSVPMQQSIERTIQWLEKGKISCEWVEATQLQKGDYVAQTIPKEVVSVANFDVDDARLYGILLGDGHLSKDGHEWGVSCNPTNDETLEFVRTYLENKGIHYWETGRGESHVHIRFGSGKGVVRNGSTGRFEESESPTLPFTYDDIYTAKHEKHIAPAFSHLPKPQALAMIKGLLETEGNVSRGTEVTFTHASKPLVEGLRYQLLRMEIPTAGNFRIRKNAHTGTRSADGSSAHFSVETHCYDLRIPATDDIAKMLGCEKLTKKNWLKVGNHLFSRVVEKKVAEVSPLVVDLKVEDDESYMTAGALAHNGGKRKGAMCAYLETWHLDIEDFLELRKNTGDERRRTHDMNTANWIPDLFMKRIQENGHWTLFSPSDVPDLHDLYGKAFEARYCEYEKLAEQGKIKLHKKIEAVQLWRKMLSMLFETGHPWITFKDPSNIRSPQDHVGVVHSSNLCTEILLNTSQSETAVCNLGSINLPMHMTPNGIDEKKLANTVRTAVRMLDNVIDINFYPIDEAQNANLRHRPIGLGLMGFQDALYMQNISYASHEAVEFADKSMEMISYYAILASSELAAEKGTYSTYKGSKWDRGLLPIDTIDLLEKERGLPVEMDKSATMDWEVVRKSIRKHGMRNSNTMAIAPTATISNITGVSQSIEPMYKHLFVKSNLSGEFTIPNIYLVNKLKELNLWDAHMLDDLKYFDGSIAEIERIPAEIKKIFLTAFEIDPEWIIECASRRQKWIDMGQSLNLYMFEPSGKKLHQMYLLSWNKGLKTNYYLRSLAATQIEKSTTDINKRGLQPRWMKNKSASSNVQVDRAEDKPVSCPLDGSCESCQ